MSGQLAVAEIVESPDERSVGRSGDFGITR